MMTLVEKRNASKFCEFHGEVGHTTDECMHLKRQIEEMLGQEKLSHLIKELKQSNGKDQAKVEKKGEAAGKDKPLAILMVQTGRKIAKQRITQTFSPKTMISFPPIGEEDGTEWPMVIEAEIGGHLVHRIWRMCVDFKDLNKACPKDGYPLPEIDWKVESLCGYPFKCFPDAYKRYHQIKIAKEDEEKTAFIIIQGIFCYSKMPFGLKNAGATYQRLVDKAFQKQIGRNLEAYVDDLVIKSCTEQEIIRDVEETFRTLRKINMKLNPKKCTFGMKEGVFLGYKVNSDGLTVCPDKVEAILSLPSPKCLKDVQRLNGKLASLNRFLSKSAERSLPFFKTLKKCTKKSDFQWTTEAEAAFQQMKESIAELPMMAAP
ncbi:reverse transcriptase domain-containing protein [Tanacetum coccineum]